MDDGTEDESLLSAFVGGDQGSFNALVARHGARVLQFARWFCRASPDSAEDIAQEIWVEVFRSAKSFRGDSKFRTWLFSVGRFVCLGWIRRQGRRREVPLETDGEEPRMDFPDKEPPPLESLQDRERDELVRRAVDRLPEHHRVVLLLRNWEDLSYEEIAESLQLPVGTVRSRLHNAMKRLSVELAAVFEEQAHEL
ncbi:MAG: RNA polymerase sigma factor [Elusimicrobia bacterium]|nr:RNA polymerase sigma factor [Elusimicrobiota bacterium]